MIGKIFSKSSGSFEARIKYIFGLSKHDHAISKIETIDSNSACPDPLPAVRAGDESIVMAMVDEFDSVEKMRKLVVDSDREIKPVLHAMLSLKPGESMTSAQWRAAVRMYLNDLGFDSSCKYIAVMHADTDHQHVHIVANRIRLVADFTVVKDNNERDRTVKSVDHIEDLFQLSKSPKPEQTWGIDISHREMKSSEKNGTLPQKHRMLAKVAGAVERTQAQGGDMFMFIRLLRRQKVYIHLAKDDKGQPHGIVYELDGKKLSGRQLKRSRLTWQKLITQEGIRYDPETISELEKEVARRDEGDTEVTIVRYQYFVFIHRRRKYPIRFKANTEEQITASIMAIIALLLSLFGVRFSVMPGAPGLAYTSYEPGKLLTLPKTHTRDEENSLTM